MLFPSIAHADPTWPPLLATKGVVSLPAIAAGLIVEYFVLRLVFKLGAVRALVADVVMNAVSAGIGLFIWNLSSSAIGLLFNRYDLWSVAIFIVGGGALVGALSEQAVLRLGFGIPYSWRGFGWLLAANAATSALAIFGTMFIIGWMVGVK